MKAPPLTLLAFAASLLVLAATGADSPAAAQPAPALGDGMVNVKVHGAKGDGTADDTVAIQAAIDAVGPTGGTVLFPPGSYVVTEVGLRPGIRYLGYGALIKRPPNQPKGTRTFNTYRSGYLYSADTDSLPLTLEGFVFDGSRTTQGEYTSFQQEQSHLLFLAADPKRPGRLRARVQNCTFRDSVADAISVYTNVEVQVSNCTAEDCFRGGLVVTGGHTRVQVSNFTAHGKTHPGGIDFEVDGAGYGGSKRIEATLDGILLPDGDFDLGVTDGSVVVASNIVARAPFNVYGGGNSTMRFNNCVFGVGEYSTNLNRIVHPGDMTFTNCQFYVDGKSSTTAREWACAHVFWWVYAEAPPRRQSLTFNDCDFRVGSGIGAADTTYAIYVEGDNSHRDDGSVKEDEYVLNVRGGTIAPEFDYGVFFRMGGRAVLKDTEIQAETALRLDSQNKWFLDVLLEGLRVSKSRTYLRLADGAPQNRITHRNMVLNEETNVLAATYGLALNTFRGQRVLLGEKPPTPATHGLVGDVYRLWAPVPGAVYEWVCTATGSGLGAVWKPLTHVGEG
jgi:hypothetical protein